MQCTHSNLCNKNTPIFSVGIWSPLVASSGIQCCWLPNMHLPILHMRSGYKAQDTHWSGRCPLTPGLNDTYIPRTNRRPARHRGSGATYWPKKVICFTKKKVPNNNGTVINNAGGWTSNMGWNSALMKIEALVVCSHYEAEGKRIHL